MVPEGVVWDAWLQEETLLRMPEGRPQPPGLLHPVLALYGVRGRVSVRRLAMSSQPRSVELAVFCPVINLGVDRPSIWT